MLIHVFKHRILPFQLSDCAALQPWWLRELLHCPPLIWGLSAMCLLFEKTFPLTLPYIQREEGVGEARSGLKRPLHIVICDSFKVAFPFWPSSTVSGPSQLFCHSGGTHSPSSILPGKFEHSVFYQPGEDSHQRQQL